MLPFLHRQTLFLAPIGVLGVVYVLSLVLQVRWESPALHVGVHTCASDD